MTDTETVLNLPDIPDLGGVVDDTKPEGFSDGWYAGLILERRAFTDKNGNDRVFESSDTPSQDSTSRNIRLQLVLKRQSDGRTLNVSHLINYRPEDLTQEAIQAVMAQKERVSDGEQWGSLFRNFMMLTRLGTLQRIAGVRQLQRNGNGGLEISPLYNKTAYFRLGEDPRNPQYKEVKAFQETAPKRLL